MTERNNLEEQDIQSVDQSESCIVSSARDPFQANDTMLLSHWLTFCLCLVHPSYIFPSTSPMLRTTCKIRFPRVEMPSGPAISLSLVVSAFFVLLLEFQIKPSGAINCYSCSSLNGSDVACQDPFHPAYSRYKEKCMVPKVGHVGVFPANFCIKLVGKNVDTDEKIMIRACVMKTMDSQCGSFKYENYSMKGCILTCDYDGCNGVPRRTPSSDVAVTAVGVFAIAWALVRDP